MDQKSSDGKPSDMLSGMNTAKKSSRKGSETGSSMKPQSLAISEHSSIKGTPQDIEEWLILSAAGSLARTSASAMPTEMELMEKEAASGKKWRTSFAWLDRDLSLWKTHQCSLLGGLEPFSETWPEWGSMEDGECFELPILAQTTLESESGYLPTPLASDAIAWTKTKKSCVRSCIAKALRGGHSDRLIYRFQWMGLSIIRASEFAEMMMGWPNGSAHLKPLETVKFRSAWLTPMKSYLAELLESKP